MKFSLSLTECSVLPVPKSGSTGQTVSGSQSGPLVAPGEPRVATPVTGSLPEHHDHVTGLEVRGHGTRRADPGTDPGLRGRDMPADARS